MRPELTQAADLLRKNTPDAVEEALGLLQNTVYSFSMKVCGHPEDAEDTMQEVLFRSLPHLTKIQDPKALAVWLYTVTRNRCWRMRRKGANTTQKTLSLDELAPDDAELARLLQDSSRSPEGNVLHSEQAQLLHRAVLQIPASLRIVLVLHDMEELSTEEVCRILGLQPGTVRVRLHRARLLLRKEMTRILEAVSAAPQPKSAPETLNKPRARSRRRPAECRDLFANLSEYLDDRVPAPACDTMRKHIEACPACVAFLKELHAAIQRCRSLDLPCDSAVASRLRTMATEEYLRMLGEASRAKSASAV